jgi:anti-sigma factor RsiW
MTILDPHLDVDQLSAAVDGERDAAVSAHLLTCLSCRAQVRTWQQSLGPLCELASATSPYSTDEMVDAAMVAWRPPPPVRRYERLKPIAAAITVVVLIAGGIFGLSRLAGGNESSSTSSAGGPQDVVRHPKSSPGSDGAAGTSASGGTSASAGTPTRAGTSGSSGTSGGRAPTLVAGDRATLASDLKRDIRTSSVPTTVPTGTPCLRAARSLAAKSPAARVDDFAAGRSSTRTGSPQAVFEVPVELRGVHARVFLFGGRAGYIAFVLSDGSCSLVTSLHV